MSAASQASASWAWHWLRCYFFPNYPCAAKTTVARGRQIDYIDMINPRRRRENNIGAHVQLGAGVGYTRAVLAADAPSLNGLKGQQLENVPLWNGNASAKYLFNPAPGYEGFARADGQYVGESYPNFDRTDPATFQRAYALLDLRTGIIHGAWEANLFVSNVFDKQAALSRFNSDNYDASTRSRIFTNRPRTAGLSLQWKF